MRTFRETLWFKYGYLDSEATAEPFDVDEDLPPVTPNLAIEDRYADDGTIRPRDSATFGIHTGCTRALAPIMVDFEAGDSDATDMRILAGELGSFRRLLPALLFAALAVVTTAAIALG